MLLRNIKEEEIPYIYEMHKDLFTYHWTLENFENELKFDVATFKVLLRNNKIIGFYIIHDLFEQLDVVLIAVSKECQHKGIGKLLLNDIELEKAKNENEYLYLEVENTNTPAISFYEKNDFFKIHERKDYYGKGRHALIYRK